MDALCGQVIRWCRKNGPRNFAFFPSRKLPLVPCRYWEVSSLCASGVFGKMRDLRFLLIIIVSSNCHHHLHHFILYWLKSVLFTLLEHLLVGKGLDVKSLILILFGTASLRRINSGLWLFVPAQDKKCMSICWNFLRVENFVSFLSHLFLASPHQPDHHSIPATGQTENMFG